MDPCISRQEIEADSDLFSPNLLFPTRRNFTYWSRKEERKKNPFIYVDLFITHEPFVVQRVERLSRRKQKLPAPTEMRVQI